MLPLGSVVVAGLVSRLRAVVDARVETDDGGHCVGRGQTSRQNDEYDGQNDAGSRRVSITTTVHRLRPGDRSRQTSTIRLCWWVSRFYVTVSYPRRSVSDRLLSFKDVFCWSMSSVFYAVDCPTVVETWRRGLVDVTRAMSSSSPNTKLLSRGDGVFPLFARLPDAGRRLLEAS